MVAARDVGLLRVGVEEFERRLAAVGDRRWGAPTPCEGWTVLDLVQHVVAGNRMAIDLLDGSPIMATHELSPAAPAAGGLAAAVAETGARQDAAFQAAAAHTVVAHPAGRVTAAEFVIYRCADIAVHAWDLARAIGVDGALAPVLIEHALPSYLRWVAMSTQVGPARTELAGPT